MADVCNPVGSLPGPEAPLDDPTVRRVFQTLQGFVEWLDRFGDTSWDHQSFFAGSVGRRAKSLYYRQKLMGTAAVAPMIFCEAFLPSARRLFHHRTRFPIADAHYAMGFGYLYRAVGDPRYLEKAVGYLDVLKATRCPGFEEDCWGYPFDWVTRNGTIARQTPLITTTPYAYEAFLLGYELCGREEWHQVLMSIARHAFADIKEFKTSEDLPAVRIPIRWWRRYQRRGYRISDQRIESLFELVLARAERNSPRSSTRRIRRLMVLRR
jgi:hypothetical protein